MQLKSLDHSLAALAAVKDLATKLEGVLTELRLTLAKLPSDMRESVTMEIYDALDQWLGDIDGTSASSKTKPSHADHSKPQVKKDSLAAKVVGILQTCGELTTGQLVNECKQRKIATEDLEAFRAVLVTTIWRRKDVFERKGERIRLRVKDVEVVD